MSLLARDALAGIPALNVKQDYSASKVLGSRIYSLPVTPSVSEIGVMGKPVEELVDYLGVFSPRYRSAAVQALSVVLYSVYRLEHAVTNRDPQGIYALSLPRRAQGFSISPRYKVNQIGHQLWCKMIDALEGFGFLEVVMKGFKGKEHMSGLRSLYRPTDACLIWLDQVLVELNVQQFSAELETLLLKALAKGGKKKCLLDYEDSDHTRGLRDQVEFISWALQRHRIEVWNPREQSMKEVPPALLSYRRHFCNDFTKGGRIFCPLQSTPKADRKKMIFDGKKTIELDFSSHQPRMCYHLKGLSAPTDCYAHPTIPRPLMKAATTRVMNCKSVIQAKASVGKLLQEEWSHFVEENLTSSGDVIDAIFKLHPIIEELMGEELWMKLQYLESSIAMGVMEGLAQNDLPCLGIHDSFLVAEDVEDRLIQLMNEEYQKRMGHLPVISRT